MESDAVTDLISAGVFATEMLEGTDIEVNKTKSENEITPKTSGYKSNICLPPKKHKYISSSDIVKSRKALQFGNPTKPKSFSLINLHNHLVGYPPELSHGAEADCHTILHYSSRRGSVD